ncbi:DNA helicase loader [Vibrio phage D479]
MLGKYDFKKYRLGLKVTSDAYNKRSDRVFFERLASKLTLNECYQLMVSNFAANSNALSYEIAGADAYEFYLKHTGYLETFSQQFKNELRTVFELISSSDKKFKDLFKGEGHPVILQLALRNTISIETFIVLNRILKFVPNVDKTYGDDIIWHDFKTRASQYESLLSIDDDLSLQLFKLVKKQHYNTVN